MHLNPLMVFLCSVFKCLFKFDLLMRQMPQRAHLIAFDDGIIE